MAYKSTKTLFYVQYTMFYLRKRKVFFDLSYIPGQLGQFSTDPVEAGMKIRSVEASQ